jgi:hypothetical protein
MADERDPTERLRDPKVSRRYQELGAEEPPRARDDAILAASRRAVDARPAPLVAPTGRRRWYFPVAAAAVIVIAVAVTLQIERHPDDEFVVASTPPRAQKEEQLLKAPASPGQPKPASAPARAPQPFTPEPPPAATAPQRADAVRDLAKSTEQPAAAPQERIPAAPATVPELRRAMESSRPQANAPMGAAASGQLQSRVMETPEAALERIAELRRQGKHEEADKALAEFRKQYPDYRLSDEMRAKVEKK